MLAASCKLQLVIKIRNSTNNSYFPSGKKFSVFEFNDGKLQKMFFFKNLKYSSI